MIGLDQYRASIGLFRCRGSPDDEEGEDSDDSDELSDKIHNLLSSLKPGETLSESLAKVLVDVSEYGGIDPNHPTVVEAKKVLESNKEAQSEGKNWSIILFQYLNHYCFRAQDVQGPSTV